MFSKACEYGLKAMIYLAGQVDVKELATLDEISKSIGSPAAFTSKVMQQLSKAGLVSSCKGPRGGFRIEPDKVSSINLSQIVSAIDGDKLMQGCGLGLKTCSEKKPCPIHHQYAAIRTNLKAMLEHTMLNDFSGKVKNEYVLTR